LEAEEAGDDQREEVVDPCWRIQMVCDGIEAEKVLKRSVVVV
jgi:hypothetical protein